MGVTLNTSKREGINATCQSMTAPWPIKMAEMAQRQRGEGGLQGLEEDRGKAAGTSSLVVLGSFKMFLYYKGFRVAGESASMHRACMTLTRQEVGQVK